MTANSLFLRFEGPLQAWGNQESKFVVRRTADAPTKSAVIGMLCAALGVTRAETQESRLPELAELRMGVRIDVPGYRWGDYHTVGAGMEMRIADPEKYTKPGAMLTRREYLCDASFLVALQGNSPLIQELAEALKTPRWTLYLGRKCCPPSRPLLEQAPAAHPDLLLALESVPWRRRLERDTTPETLEYLVDWFPTPDQPEAPDDAEVWYDVPLTFEPPSHRPRFVLRGQFSVGAGRQVAVADSPLQRALPTPQRPTADYRNSEYRKMREHRLDKDNHLCVFCRSRATTVQHVTYRHAGGDERLDELKSLCRLCHDAVTMLEYGLNMGLDRIDPEDPRWRERITEKRDEIVEFRSLETRRRRLEPEEVE